MAAFRVSGAVAGRLVKGRKSPEKTPAVAIGVAITFSGFRNEPARPRVIPVRGSLVGFASERRLS
jgi:hypothetical protein